MTGEALLNTILPAWREKVGPAVGFEWFDRFIAAQRDAIVTLLQKWINKIRAKRAAKAAPPDEWTTARRTKANLAAVKILASKSPDEMTSEDRRTLMAYSGWGGLSIRNVRDKFPEGWSPEKYGLIHEYYTPTRVARSIGDAICGLLGDIGGTDGRVLALEPSAGIGRLVFGVEQAECEGKPPIDWITTEFSRVSAAILPALLPGHDHNHETFEKWLDANGSEYQGRVHLVVSNPPYGERGLAKQQDESEEYEEAMAYMYFLRRGLDILAPNGIGVFLVPAGFLTGKRQRDLRKKILKRHHLSAAFRLPSKLFPGAQLVVDLLFFRSRGGELTKVDAEDEFILEGRYFRRYPSHILGVERGVASDEDDQTKEPSGRDWYRVDGTFEGLPAFSERAVCESCRITPYSWAIPDTPLREVERKASGETAAIRAALYLGVRVKEFTDALEAKSTRTLDLWADLKLSIEDFVGSRMYRDAGGPRNPHQWSELVALAEKNEAAAGFLSAFTETGDLAPAIRYRPSVRLVWSGSNADILGQAEFLYRRQRWLDIDALLEFHEAHDGKMSRDEVRAALLANEWFLDPHSGPRNAPENAEFLTPERDYTTGPLWRKYDYAEARASDPQWARQAAVLLEAIDTIEFEDIPDITPRAGWIPTNVLSDWVADTIAPGVRISRDEGVYTANSREYEKLHKDRSIPTEVLWLIGWLTHDTGLFKPVDPEPDDPKEKQKRRPIAVRRAEQAAKWVESFQSWAGASTEQRTRITEAYNRAFQGYIVPNYSKDPLDIARMSGKVKLHPHQTAGARRVLDNRGGLVAYDVGVGKTYTALAVIARARQEGWARRPVVIVPTSLVWKWYDDFGRILPDYRVLVIGQKRIKRQRGEAVKEARVLLEAGSINAEQYERRITTSTSDGIDRQAEKWLAFMGGAYDAVILTHEAMKNVRLNNEEIIDYAEHQSAIQRSVKTTVRRANEQSETKRKLSERQEAVIEHGVARWVADTLKTSKRQDFIQGLYWSDIGIDLLVVDEAADFKNLYMPERREGGKIPEFMGSGGDPSDRAWQLDFRAAGVRRNTGGTGIVLLTATPAKNSPLEYYNLVQYIDPNAWTRLGVDDPEQFIDRYILTESRDVITRTFDVERRQAVVGFSNLDELRTVLLRYGEFKSAEDVDLKLPEPRISQVTVKMDKRQEAKYAKEVARLELLLKDPVGLTPEEEAEIEDVKRQALGIQERLNYVALHADGDEGYRWSTAFGGTETRKVSLVSMSTWLEKGWTVVGALEQGDTEAEMTRELPRPDPHGPKFERCALNIKAQRNCGHIVFMQSVAPHLWFKEVLIEHGIPEDRIAILNAKAVPAAVKRTDLAKAFTGDPETGDEPAYDVIICNSVAYEGLDLQLRTCAIHHLDMPWTPGDLEQRNGRGYRQNNSCPILNIYYYVSEESTDGIRFKKVEGKSTWMSELLRSSKSVINNPAAEAAISAEEMLIRLSRNKEGVRKLIEERDRRKLATAQAEHRRVATKALHVANERFRAARATLDSGRAQRLREEGESLLAEVRKQDTESWPWAPWAELVREVEAFIPDPPTGPVFESLRVTRPDRVYDNKIEAFEFGRVIRDDGEARITMRGAGGATWRALDGDGVRQLHIKPAHLPGVSTLEWPADDDRLTRENIDRVVAAAFRFGAGTWERLGWRGASDTWIEKWWPVFSKPILAGIMRAGSERLPVVRDGVLEIRAGTILRRVEVLPPTLAGWRRYLELAPASGLKFGQLEEAGRFWFAREFPRGLVDVQQARAATYTTPGTRVTWRSVAEWIDGLETIKSRKDAKRRREAAKAHIDALIEYPQVLEAADASSLDALVDALNTLTEKVLDDGGRASRTTLIDRVEAERAPASEAPTETWRTDGVRAKWSNLKEWLAVLHDLEQRRDSVPRKNKLRAHYDALDKDLEAALDQSTLVEVHEAWRVLSSTTRDDGGYSPRSEQRARILDALDRRCAKERKSKQPEAAEKGRSGFDERLVEFAGSTLLEKQRMWFEAALFPGAAVVLNHVREFRGRQGTTRATLNDLRVAIEADTLVTRVVKERGQFFLPDGAVDNGRVLVREEDAAMVVSVSPLQGSLSVDGEDFERRVYTTVDSRLTGASWVYLHKGDGEDERFKPFTVIIEAWTRFAEIREALTDKSIALESALVVSEEPPSWREELAEASPALRRSFELLEREFQVVVLDRGPAHIRVGLEVKKGRNRRKPEKNKIAAVSLFSSKLATHWVWYVPPQQRAQIVEIVEAAQHGDESRIAEVAKAEPEAVEYSTPRVIEELYDGDAEELLDFVSRLDARIQAARRYDPYDIAAWIREHLDDDVGGMLEDYLDKYEEEDEPIQPVSEFIDYLREAFGMIMHEQSRFESRDGGFLVPPQAVHDGMVLVLTGDGAEIVPVDVREVESEDDEVVVAERSSSPSYLVAADDEGGDFTLAQPGAEGDADAAWKTFVEAWAQLDALKTAMTETPVGLRAVRGMLDTAAALVLVPACRGREQQNAIKGLRRAEKLYVEAAAAFAGGGRIAPLQSTHKAIKIVAEIARDVSEECAIGQTSFLDQSERVPTTLDAARELASRQTDRDEEQDLLEYEEQVRRKDEARARTRQRIEARKRGEPVQVDDAELDEELEVESLGPDVEEEIERWSDALTKSLAAPLYRPKRANDEDCGCKGDGYIASEALWHLLGGAASGYTPRCVRHEGTSHWYLQGRNGHIVDLTASQFSREVPYQRGRARPFLRERPSQRACVLMRRARNLQRRAA